jgi:hypothetical protein
MMETYPQVEPSRLSGDEDEWRVLIQWAEGAPTALYTVPQALGEAERLTEASRHEVARAIREAAEQVPLD